MFEALERRVRGGQEKDGKLESYLRNAFSSLHEEGIEEPTILQLGEAVQRIHPPKHRWQVTATLQALSATLGRLEQNGDVVSESVSPDEDHGIFNRVYRRVVTQQTAPAE